MIWLLLAWCGVAVWLGLAIGRVLREPRHEYPVANQGRTLTFQDVRATQSPRTDDDAPPNDQIREVHHLLAALDEFDPRLAKTAMLRWIGGLSRPAIAATLGITVDVVERDLQLAKVLLRDKSGTTTLPPRAS